MNDSANTRYHSSSSSSSYTPLPSCPPHLSHLGALAHTWRPEYSHLFLPRKEHLCCPFPEEAKTSWRPLSAP
ncbi:hypothetical protein E2C01_049354 [Portunus trituberculatus]|uniref:Uncharacterized protein n=1 Tax=Portunus trituberculatus TaxID=210409 RepID=A0A5B7GCV1_PORTR|nr:hypothetical protein [Portunus trituberculatus]